MLMKFQRPFENPTCILGYFSVDEQSEPHNDLLGAVLALLHSCIKQALPKVEWVGQPAHRKAYFYN